jgi:carboxyl-terminal processing protease
MKNFFLQKFFLIVVVLSISMTPLNNRPQVIQSATQKKEREKIIFQWFRTISEVIHLLAERHYKNVDIATVIQNGLRGAVASTGPHSAFFPKKSYKAAMESTSGEFSGIGVSIMNKRPEDNFLMITDVIKGGPSDRAGLKTGDKIVEIDRESLRNLSSDEVVGKLRGKIGTKVKLKIIRNKKPLEFTIKREIIKDQSLLCHKLKNQNIYYISLRIFAENTPSQTAKILKKINGKGCKGIILDIRRNPGGVLESAVAMAGLFLPKKSLVVSTKDKYHKVVANYHTKRNPVWNKNIPIFILVDNFTASASEILAGCMRHYSEKYPNKLSVFIVGTKTFGKGSVQEVIPVSNGCALKITTMLYYIPDDVSIQAEGIAPDFTVKTKISPEKEVRWVKELYGKESSQKNYITAEEAKGLPPKKKEDKAKKEAAEKAKKEFYEKNWEARYKKAVSEDVQIRACVNMISILDIAKKTNPSSVDTRKKAYAFLSKHYVTDKEFELEKL